MLDVSQAVGVTGVAALEPHLHEAALLILEALLPRGMVPKAAEVEALWAAQSGHPKA